MTDLSVVVLCIGGIAAFIVGLTLLSGLRIVNQYERAVVFRLGTFAGTRGPGLFYVTPWITSVRKVDLRTLTIEVPPQEIITRDNVTMKVSAVVYFNVVDPQRAIINVADYLRASVQIAQTTLRNVLGQSDLDQVLAEREVINHRLQVIIDEQTEPWGVKVTTVALKDVELPLNLQRAMAKQAEAEREKRAKIIAADGELQASHQLSEAAHVMSMEPATLQLRYLQTLTEIAVEKNSTIIFPLPIDLVEPFAQILKAAAARATNGTAPPTTPPATPSN
ncbi:MAG: slipin family protein [Ktedonobacterales bacterium]|nr:slipin family protein [Ktedonobacterales bacterium]